MGVPRLGTEPAPPIVVAVAAGGGVGAWDAASMAEYRSAAASRMTDMRSAMEERPLMAVGAIGAIGAIIVGGAA